MRYKLNYGEHESTFESETPGKKMVDIISRNHTHFDPEDRLKFRRTIAMEASEWVNSSSHDFRYDSDEGLAQDFIAAGLLEVLDERPQV
jgi:hypothetical protein